VSCFGLIPEYESIPTPSLTSKDDLRMSFQASAASGNINTFISDNSSGLNRNAKMQGKTGGYHGQCDSLF